MNAKTEKSPVTGSLVATALRQIITRVALVIRSRFATGLQLFPPARTAFGQTLGATQSARSD